MCTNKVSDIICFNGSQDYKEKQSFEISLLVLWANKQALPVMKDKTRTKSQLITSVHEWACLGWNFLQILCKHYLHTTFESMSHSQRGRCQGQESSLRFANIASHIQPQSQSENSTTTFDGSLNRPSLKLQCNWFSVMFFQKQWENSLMMLDCTQET
jgi:hypothetical protein